MLTLVSACFNAGAILGPLLGGTIGERYGYRAIFLFAALLFLLSTTIILFIRSQPTESPQQEEKSGNLFKNQHFLIFIFAYFFATFAMYLPQPLSPNFLQNERGLNLAQIGQLYSVNGLGIVALNLILGQLNARLGFLIGQVAVWVFVMMLWKGNGIPVYAMAYFLLGGFRAARSLAIAYVRSVIKKSNMGLAFGFAETTTALALFLAPPLAGYLYGIRPASVYTVSLAVIILSLLVSVSLSFPLLLPGKAKNKSPSEEAV
jgi:predicted MFS family arabinose efflux permease